MFHVELRRFPNVARAFNLDEHELDAQIVLPYVRGLPIEFDDRRWTADKTRLTIYEGPPVAREDRGLGRGWALVTRDGVDVTGKLLDVARARIREASPDGVLPRLKRELLAAAAGGGLALSEAVAIAERDLPGRRASESVALTERAVWELLHEGGLTLTRTGLDEAVRQPEWRAMLLAWESWTDPAALRLTLRHNVRD